MLNSKVEKMIDVASETGKATINELSQLQGSMSSITPEQVDIIEKKRKEYLSNIDKDDSVAVRLMSQYASNVYQAYLSEITTKYSPKIGSPNINIENRLRYFDITKWVIDPEEENTEKLTNVYQVLSQQDCSIALIYQRSQVGCKVILAVANIGENDSPDIADQYVGRIKKSIKGNFPGATLAEDVQVGSPIQYVQVQDESTFYYSLAAVSNLASDKSEGFISQSMEKLLDGIVPENKSEEYSLVLLATPYKSVQQAKDDLANKYTALSSMAQLQTNVAITEGEMLGTASNLGANIGVNFGVSAGVNIGRTINNVKQIGSNTGETRTFTNYGVKHLLDTIEKQMARLEESDALGMWKFAAYAISANVNIAEDVAHMYLALTQGNDSFVSKAKVNVWQGGMVGDCSAISSILENVYMLRHPEFAVCSDENESFAYPTPVDLTTKISGKDLARALNFPRKSVSGFPVIEAVAYGRDVQRYSANDQGKTIPIGQIVHMRNKEKDKTVKLSTRSLTSHTFITGSTGTGKTTATLQLIEQARKEGVNILVIEPTKGEYKDKVGGIYTVLGTNENVTDKLIKMNPFWFPQHVHVLEHIDRLIEILNASWPMYAAMPAVLKDAIERAYINSGWNLTTSESLGVYPTFFDLLETLPEVMDDSMYSKDTKSDYSGALITRVKSLTNGLNKSIFCDEYGVSDKELFEKNVIVDISRIGSVETKSLIMGVLIMKLQEYWIDKGEFSKELKHLTVLEEAHNILRRTSTAQAQEGANLQGKSVEMITNGIAEMRAYGEGFIIADQAPNLLDEAVIRNTNTKIVLRLPDADDRITVGKSCSLNEKQIDEIGKLPDYTAVVYQNDWIEAVLCYFSDFTDVSKYEKLKELNNIKERDNSNRFIMYLFDEKNKIELTDGEKTDALQWIEKLQLSSNTKRLLRRAFVERNIDRKALAYNMFQGKMIARVLDENYDENKAIELATRKIRTLCSIKDEDVLHQICMQIILQVCMLKDGSNFADRYKEIAERRAGLV